MIENMNSNLAYTEHLKIKNLKDEDGKILEYFKECYRDYRDNWLNLPKKMYQKNGSFLKDRILDINPMCVDIELAAICDLGCPHCFREYLMTPDKIMKEDLFYKIIESVKKMNVPSIKLNWRGEPLLHPKIYDFIKYSKKVGILDVILNTNATKLDEVNSKKLILSGIDQVIFSFDGGTKETYEKMRPGRFEFNSFEKIYKNIKTFCELRNKMGMQFPSTKIQMVLTADTRNEVNSFHSLFDGIVDDVTVIQYNERGGEVSDQNGEVKNKISSYLKNNNLPEDTPFMVTADQRLFISKGRIPCDQIFQRLMVTFDGRIGMCCHDWGAQHCIGYIDDLGFKHEEAIKGLEEKIKSNKKGFELLKNTKKPNKFNEPKKEINKLDDIWNNDELNFIRDQHKEFKSDSIDVCKNCSFKDTYSWIEI
jgi:MoaA/NifB/PqqE/SkfB family radical SAM enzyme